MENVVKYVVNEEGINMTEEQTINSDYLSIYEIINNFNKKIENYYQNMSIMSDKTLRMFNGTDIDLEMFYSIYKNSRFFKDETIDDKKINKKIIYSLIDIILLNIMINEIDMIDNIGINTFKSDKEFNDLYNLNKSMNLIYKTRVLWERIMNFSYLVFNRKELDVGKSKKKKFRKWYKEDNNFVFFDELFNFISVFDEKYRTPETHNFSYLRKLFFNGSLSPIKGISLRLTMNFNVEIYQNILRVLQDEEYVVLSWHRVKSINNDIIPEEFNKIPEWVEYYCEDFKQNKDVIEQVQIPFNIKTGKFINH